MIAIVAGRVYIVMHGLWLATAGIVVAAALIGWFGKKVAATGGKKQRIQPFRSPFSRQGSGN